jgi:hypothetical protein
MGTDARMHRLVVGLALSVMLAMPSVAEAATKYVRKAGGLDSNDCSQPSQGAGNVGPFSPSARP